MSVYLKPLSEQVVLITGASSGIGLATARIAAKRGAKVMLVARTETALSVAVDDIGKAGGDAGYAVCDVGSQEEVNAAAQAAVDRFGRIDSWVNCAGVAIYATLVDTPPAEHERLIRTNYFGVVNGALAAVRHLRQEGGALITVGSVACDLPSPIMGAYAASKHAAKAYIESLQIELNADRTPISVTLIKPSGTNTPIAEHAANHVDGEARIPPPIYDPALVAEAILDAAVHSRRTVTVGGIGRLQVLLASYFPGVYARLGRPIAALLSDPDRPKTTADNLDLADAEGRERSLNETGRRVSVYGPAARYPATTAVIGGVALIGAIAFLVRWREPR